MCLVWRPVQLLGAAEVHTATLCLPWKMVSAHTPVYQSVAKVRMLRVIVILLV